VEIFLIRHTAPAVENGICYGRSDVPLAASAQDDIEAALTPLPQFDLVYSSPSQRCSQLATAITRRDGCRVVIAPALYELDFGDWENKPWSEIQREQSDPWADDPWHRAPPGGETEQALWTRVADWYATKSNESVARCAVVAHGGPLRVLRCLILRLDVEQRWSWSLAWGKHARFETRP
jgi:alpha-ribazole phosphatase